MEEQLEHIEAIEKRLWSAADNLRANSNYASNEYFMPVMGLIFLESAILLQPEVQFANQKTYAVTIATSSNLKIVG